MTDRLLFKQKIFFNRIIDKKQLKKILTWAFNFYGSAETAYLADQLKELGFRYATKAGISLGIDDLLIPPIKRELLELTDEEIRNTEQRYLRGEITKVERFHKIIDTWNRTSETLKDEVVKNFKDTNLLNPLYMMAFSGARGNISQVHQLVGMRGLMADPQGEIIDFPIKSNFKEGLTITEYLISSYGARKGLVDTALRTADSGYLTRRMVDVAQDVIIREVDCKTEEGISLNIENFKNIHEKLIGRVLNNDIFNPQTNSLIATRNQIISDILAQEIIKAKIPKIFVRSPATCNSDRALCQYCYGWSLAHSRLVDLGEAVGIIAAQSIGEPGTQLTMRTFHTGGVFTGKINRQLKAPFEGKVTYPKDVKLRAIRTRHGDDGWLVETNTLLILKAESGKTAHFNLIKGSVVRANPNQLIQENQILVEFANTTRAAKAKNTKDLTADLTGEVQLELNLTTIKNYLGNSSDISELGYIWILSGEVYNLPSGAKIISKNGDLVKNGSVLARTQFVTKYGGEVRISTPNKQTSLEVKIRTAFLLLKNAKVQCEIDFKSSQYFLTFENGDRFLLKVKPGKKLFNHQVIAELANNPYRTETGGLVLYSGIEVLKTDSIKTNYQILKGGTILWVPEETHEISKPSIKLFVKEGQYIKAGTEIFKNRFCKTSGRIELFKKNNILREIVIKPGKIYQLSKTFLEFIKSKYGNYTILKPDIELLPNLKIHDLCLLEYLGNSIILRPILQYRVPKTYVTSNESLGKHSDLKVRMVQKTAYKHGERIKSIDGVELITTQLILEIDSKFSHMGAEIEFITNKFDLNQMFLQFIIFESILIQQNMIVNSMQDITQIHLFVKTGQILPPGALVAQIEILCKSDGKVRGLPSNSTKIRNLLVITDTNQTTVPVKNLYPNIKLGSLLYAGDEIAPHIKIAESGQVIELNNQFIKLRIARPYLVSKGTIIRVKNGDLVEYGDILASFIVEVVKTGDIVQGLPRIEELLEARLPKDYDEDWDNVQVLEGEEENPHIILGMRFEELSYCSRLSLAERTRKSFQTIQTFLVDELQSIYRSQGVNISDKHIELIINQMTSRVKVRREGDVEPGEGELTLFKQIEKANKTIANAGGIMANYRPLLMGITKAALHAESFLSAASFQETTKVLTRAALAGKKDKLRGLKENVITGRLIPAGTGFNTDKHSKDSKINLIIKDKLIKENKIEENYSELKNSLEDSLDRSKND
uniref:DNA-directed RNA polymerase n=1 Tax=Glaucocystis incrassata TaxID=1789788 RepID=A0A3G1IVL3_9EUKA|nr:RNA polymerase beta'' subunit [Glaucocystis incrassata]ASQ40080.1 RNA polymerase beta'' subunit [Glaucocystis incrassata]